VDPLRLATAPQLLAAIVRLSLTVILAAAAAMVEAPTMGPTGGPVVEAVAVVETTRTATPPEPHRAATTPARRLRSYGARRLLRQATTTASPLSPRDFVTSSPPVKFKPLGITKYDAKQDPIQWLRCYALSVENAGGNNDTKCPYFPFCLDQAPLTWLESLDKHSIDKWDQLKQQFTSNFAGAMGCSGTRMDLAMVKQE
jgi:hypothetical protein